MQLSKWAISTLGNFNRADSSAVNRNARIILLDDHRLFREGLINCIRPFFKFVEILTFRNGDRALAYLQNQISENKIVDLFITDISHPGLHGNELVKQLRIYEKQFNSIHKTPILIISMVDETAYPELMAEKIVNAYLTKASEVDVIIDCLENLLYV